MKTHYLSLLLVACGGAQTSTVVIADLDAPPPVQAELTRHFGREAELTLESDVEDDGSTEYEATVNVPMELELSPGGHILKMEFVVPLTLVPAAVVSAAERLWPGAAFDEAEVVVEDGQLLWEIEATRDGNELEAYFYPDGRVRSAEPAVEAVESEVPDAAESEEPNVEEPTVDATESPSADDESDTDS